MKELISLDGNGNKFRICRGGDGDIHLGFDCPEKGVFLESVRVGVGNSGGQEVPFYVKRALQRVYDAMERWGNGETQDQDEKDHRSAFERVAGILIKYFGFDELSLMEFTLAWEKEFDEDIASTEVRDIYHKIKED